MLKDKDGNVHYAIGDWSDETYPFFIMHTPNEPDGSTGFIRILDDAVDVTISIYKKIEYIEPLDPKFLPPSLDKLVINSSTSGSTKQFELTVDDSGKLVITAV